MDTMTHSTALATHAVDRYALGDMRDDEATAFETHYFDCADCAREVRETMSFVDNARVALRQDAPAAAPTIGGAWRFGRLRPAIALPWAAVLALGLLSIFQAVGPSPSGNDAGARLVSLTALRVVRAEIPVVRVDGPTFLLYIDVTTPEPQPRYGLEFRNEADEVVATIDAAAAPTTGTFVVELSSDEFPDGTYSAILEGIGEDGGRRPVDTYRFTVSRTVH